MEAIGAYLAISKVDLGGKLEQGQNACMHAWVDLASKVERSAKSAKLKGVLQVSQVRRQMLIFKEFSAKTLSAKTLSAITLSAKTLSAKTLSAKTLSAKKRTRKPIPNLITAKHPQKPTLTPPPPHPYRGVWTGQRDRNKCSVYGTYMVVKAQGVSHQPQNYYGSSPFCWLKAFFVSTTIAE